MSDYRNLDVWRLGHRTRLSVYRLTERYPQRELFELASQTRRAASSITMNIAEGSGRSNRDFARMLRIAEGSANEVEDQLLLARDLGYVTDEDWKATSSDLAHIRAMLIRLRAYLLSADGSRDGSRRPSTGDR